MGKKLSKVVKGDEVENPPHPREPDPSSFPYHGPAAKYHFVHCEVALKNHQNFRFMSDSIITSNIDTYYSILAEHHKAGRKLLTFYRIPGQMRRGEGIFNPDRLVPFQGIHCSYPSDSSMKNTKYELRVEKSVIHPGFVPTPLLTSEVQVYTNTHHLFQTLAHYADNGSRLICIEITGDEKLSPSLFDKNLPALGCDLFFEVPIGEATQKYIYKCVCIPVKVTITPGFTNKVKVKCDWEGVLNEYLKQGWRLVEIFYDQSSHSKTNGRA